MIPVYGFENQTLAILGLGRSGLSSARALREGGADVICWDDNEPAREAAASEGFALKDLTKEGALEGVASLIVSPGIPHLYPAPHPAISNAWMAGVPVDNDIGLFFRAFASDAWVEFETPPRVIAITGSNGKSTTAALLHHILLENDVPSQLGGNIGRGVLDLDPPENGEVIVLELSSYQTELARALTPDVAVWTNISEDHLDRHGGFGGYVAAKRRLFAEGGPDRAVIGVDEPEGKFVANQLVGGFEDSRLIRVSSAQKLSGTGWSVFAKKGFLSEWRKGRQVASLDLRAITQLAGAHNHQNACAAYGAARAINIAPKAIEQALHSFEGLPHRSQLIATKDGVQFVNDSKATNVDAAAKALAAYPSVRWIAGGIAKEGGIGALKDALANVAKAYLIGESAPEFASILDGIDHEICGTIDAAVAAAARDAKEGDTVLLAPAAASFDQYPNFEKRGEAFADAVGAL